MQSLCSLAQILRTSGTEKKEILIKGDHNETSLRQPDGASAVRAILNRSLVQRSFMK